MYYDLQELIFGKATMVTEDERCMLSSCSNNTVL